MCHKGKQSGDVVFFYSRKRHSARSVGADAPVCLLPVWFRCGGERAAVVCECVSTRDWRWFTHETSKKQQHSSKQPMLRCQSVLPTWWGQKTAQRLAEKPEGRQHSPADAIARLFPSSRSIFKNVVSTFYQEHRHVHTSRYTTIHRTSTWISQSLRRTDHFPFSCSPSS